MLFRSSDRLQAIVVLEGELHRPIVREIDGAPAARFVQRLKDLIESSYGLDDSTFESEQVVAPVTSKKS